MRVFMVNKGMLAACPPGHWPPKTVGIWPTHLACPAWPWEPGLLSFLPSPQHSTYLQLVLMLLVDTCKQLGFPSVEGVDEGITLGHQASLKLHTVLLCERAHVLVPEYLGSLGCQKKTELPCPFVRWKSLPKETEKNSVYNAHLAFF